jgi:hypothetical protein
MPPKPKARVDLIVMLEVLDTHLTSALCEAAWGAVRIAERQRKWTLELLLRFWAAVTLAAPRSLRDALAWAAGTPGARYPGPVATPEAFFARCQDLRWQFFEEAFRRFLAAATAGLPARFAPELHGLLGRFPTVLAIDGSGLDPVARRLKALRRDRRVPLPGALLAIYDICRGVLTHLTFEPDARTAEFNRASDALGRLARGSLLVADRLYGVPKFFAALAEHGLLGVCRRFGAVRLDRLLLASSTQTAAGVLEDYDVLAGTPQRQRQTLRLLRLKVNGKVVLELFSNVLDRTQLSAVEAFDLYRARWKVERVFSDLKEVLSLNRFHAANTNAVGMQVFSAAMVHTALRIAQGGIAEQVGIAPEALSTKKLFPKVAAAAQAMAVTQHTLIVVQELNPEVKLKLPTMRQMPFAYLPLAELLVEVRRGRRTTRHNCPSRGQWRAMPGLRKRPKGTS